MIDRYQSYFRYMTVAAIALAAFSIFLVLGRDSTIPVYFKYTETLNSPLPQGGDIVVRVHREKYRDDCPVISNRRAQNQVTGRSYDIQNATWNGGPMGTDYIDLTYETSHLPVGEYVLFVSLTYQCPTFIHDVDQPPTFFKIEDRK